MEIALSSLLPKQWVGAKPIESYETQFLYTGFSRYNTAKKSLSQIVRKEDGTIWYSDAPCDATVFPRAYATESVRITIYSVSPRVWKEEAGLSDVRVFIQRGL